MRIYQENDTVNMHPEVKFKNIAQIYDFVEKEARVRVQKFLDNGELNAT